MDSGSGRTWSPGLLQPSAAPRGASVSPSLSPPGREGLVPLGCLESDGESWCHMAKRNEVPGTHPNMSLAGRCFPAALSPVPGTTRLGPMALLTVRARRGLWSGGSQHRPASPSASSASQPSQSSWCHHPRWWRSRCHSASCCPQRSGWDKPGGGEPKTPAGPGGRSAACNPH